MRYLIVDNHLDLSLFDRHYRNDQNGAAAYPPSIMLKIIFYAYSLGMLSSRRIERACINNITFMCLSGDTRPHFTTIAAFIAKMKDTIEPLFTQVLMICDEQGLIERNMFAIDRCKISSNASKEWSVIRTGTSTTPHPTTKIPTIRLLFSISIPNFHNQHHWHL